MQALYNAALEFIGAHGQIGGPRTRTIHRVSYLITSQSSKPVWSGIIPSRPCRIAKSVKFLVSWYPNSKNNVPIHNCSQVFQRNVSTADGDRLQGSFLKGRAPRPIREELRYQGASDWCVATLPPVRRIFL